MKSITAARLARTDAGTTEPAALFLTGWCGDRFVYDDVVSRLAAAPGARRAVAPDWRGHGETPLGADDFGQAELVADTIGLLDELGIQTVIPVAVAHAGWVAIELRRLLGPERVPGVVLLDWMVLGAPEPFMGALAGLQHPDSWQQVRAALFGMWTEGVDVPAVHECVERMGRQGFEMWSRAAREIEAAFTAEPVPLAALDGLDCPTLHLYAQPDDPAYLAGQQAYAAANPWFEVVKLDARSHFPMVEVPDLVAAHVDRFAAHIAG